MHLPSLARQHGGPQPQELLALGLDPAEVLDFSVNVNPYGPAPAVLAAAREACLHLYPDPSATVARAAVAAALDVPVTSVALGDGANALLWSLALLHVARGDRALVACPSYGEFPAAVQACGGAWEACWAQPLAAPLQLDRLAAAVRDSDARVVYLASPNTPTGQHTPVAQVAHWAREFADVTVILDQSFLSMSHHAEEAALRLPDNVLRVRSLTKDHALCGLRVGYVLGAPAPIAALEAARPAWSVSAPAQAAAAAAIVETAFVAASRDAWLREAATLHAALMPDRPLTSSTAFFLVPVHDAPAVRQRLLVEHRVLVRDCTSFGLPNHVRVGARNAADNAALASLGHIVC